MPQKGGYSYDLLKQDKKSKTPKKAVSIKIQSPSTIKGGKKNNKNTRRQRK